MPIGRESDAFSLPATAAEMRDFASRTTTSTGSTPGREPLESHLSRAGVFADFQRFVLGGAGRPQAPDGNRNELADEDDDRQEYYGMYS